MKFRTTAAYVSGAICGNMWMPDAKAGLPFHGDVRQQINRFSSPEGTSFRDVLLHMLMEKGGDFQNARFAADTCIRIERRTSGSAGKYQVHVKELELATLPDCADLVDAESYSSDFFND